VVKRILNQRLNLGQKQRQKPIRHKRFADTSQTWFEVVRVVKRSG